MSRLSRVLLSVILTASVAVISFLAGELVGMKSGYAYTLKMTAPIDAAYTVSVINLLESSMNGEAKEMLETRLDNYIVSHWSAERCGLTGLNPFLKEGSREELFQSAITHRKANPSENELVGDHLRGLEERISEPRD